MSVRRRGTNSISDEDLLTRTSFVEARTAYKQVKKVREVKHLRDLISFIALCEFSFVTYLVYIKIGENNICIKIFLCIENTVVNDVCFYPRDMSIYQNIKIMTFIHLTCLTCFVIF